MESALTRLGLSTKETKFYLFLLKEGSLGASKISAALKESRTNTYMVLTKLIEEKLALATENSGVKKFTAASPSVLKQRLEAEEKRLQASRQTLEAILPGLEEDFKAGREKAASAQTESIRKYSGVIKELTGVSSSVDVIVDSQMSGSSDAMALLKQIVISRGAQRPTRAIFHESLKTLPLIKELAQGGLELNFTPQKSKTGGAIIFADNVALITASPKLFVKVVHNQVLAGSFQAVFEQLWQTNKERRKA